MRFGWLEATRREIAYVFWDMSRSYVSHMSPLAENSVITPLRNEEHVEHVCERRNCLVPCRLCKRLCSGGHLHGLVPNQSHLCGYVCNFPFRDVIYLGVLGKNTLVVPRVLHQVSAKYNPSPSRRLLLEGMKLSNIQKYASLC